MKFFKKFWPTTFKVKKGKLLSLIVQLIIFLIICAVIGWLISILGKLPIIGLFAGLVGTILEIYSVVGIVLCVLNFLGIKLG